MQAKIPDASFYKVIKECEPEINCVWIPGWGGTAWTLRPIIERMGFGTHYLIDPIHARQLEKGHCLSIEDMVQAILQGLDKEISSFHLIGISMGGLIAQVLASTFPRKVRSLHLCCTNTGGFGGHKPINSETAKLWHAPPQKGDDPVRRILERCVSPDFAATGEFLDYLEHCRKTPNPVTGRTLKMQWEAIANFHAAPYLGSIRIPSFLYEGSADKVVAKGEKELITRYLNTISNHIINGGHLFFLESSKEFESLLKLNIQTSINLTE